MNASGQNPLDSGSEMNAFGQNPLDSDSEMHALKAESDLLKLEQSLAC
jgi:hypothetical protein